MNRHLFEYDNRKSRSNKEKHGIDFEEAQELWKGDYVIVPAKNVFGESRKAILGKWEEKLYVAIYMGRGETLRIISCHRADERWEKMYETHIQKS